MPLVTPLSLSRPVSELFPSSPHTLVNPRREFISKLIGGEDLQDRESSFFTVAFFTLYKLCEVATILTHRGVNFGLQRSLQGAVGVVGAEEVGMADEEASFVVVGIDEPTGNAVGPVANDFAGLWFENIYAVDSDLCIVAGG